MALNKWFSSFSQIAGWCRRQLQHGHVGEAVRQGDRQLLRSKGQFQRWWWWRWWWQRWWWLHATLLFLTILTSQPPNQWWLWWSQSQPGRLRQPASNLPRLRRNRFSSRWEVRLWKTGKKRKEKMKNRSKKKRRKKGRTGLCLGLNLLLLQNLQMLFFFRQCPLWRGRSQSMSEFHFAIVIPIFVTRCVVTTTMHYVYFVQLATLY